MLDAFGYVAPVVSIFFGVLGIGLFFHERYHFFKTSWCLASGYVVKSFVKERYNRLDQDTSTAFFYEPVVEYEFEVGQKKYKGENVYTGGKFRTTDKIGISRIVKKYPEKLRVDVYYKAGDPAVSCLEKKLHGSLYPFLYLGVVFFLVGICMLSYQMTS